LRRAFAQVRRVVASRPVRRILSGRLRSVERLAPAATIHLGRRLPADSSGLPGVSADGPSSPCVALLPVGFAKPPGSPRALVRSYRTVSPLPVRGHSGDWSRHRRSVFCGTFLRVTPTGRYPAPCPKESGRSSDRCAEAPGTRPPGRLATISIVAQRAGDGLKTSRPTAAPRPVACCRRRPRRRRSRWSWRRTRRDRTCPGGTAR
jgi:hypothetical protein